MHLRDAADDLPHVAHRNGRLKTAARNVSDRDDDTAVDEAEGVVPVATDLRFGSPRSVKRIERESVGFRQIGGQRRDLEGFGCTMLALEKASLVNGESGSAPEFFEHRDVLGRVLASGWPVIYRQRAEGLVVCE